MQPFSRNPQVRITQKAGSFRLIAAAVSQRDFTSGGGSAPLRNSSVPDLNAQVHFSRPSADGKRELLVGGGGEFKTLLPQISTTGEDGKYETNEKVSSLAGMAFLKYKTPSFTFKVQGVYGQNLYDLTMLGGYAVSEVIDADRNTVGYTTVDVYSVWSEVMFQRSPRWQYAVWAGYTENAGSEDPILAYSNKFGGTDVTVRGAAADNSSDIKRVFRVSPRVVAIAGNLSFALETEYTDAAYAAKDDEGVLFRDEFGKITKTESRGNLRVLFSAILKF